MARNRCRMKCVFDGNLCSHCIKNQTRTIFTRPFLEFIQRFSWNTTLARIPRKMRLPWISVVCLASRRRRLYLQLRKERIRTRPHGSLLHWAQLWKQADKKSVSANILTPFHPWRSLSAVKETITKKNHKLGGRRRKTCAEFNDLLVYFGNHTFITYAFENNGQKLSDLWHGSFIPSLTRNRWGSATEPTSLKWCTVFSWILGRS